MEGDRETAAYEVIVVGAGAIGLSIGWRLAQRGVRTVVLDAEQPGSGATGVAAGMLAPVTEADFGEEALVALNLAGLRRWPAFAADLQSASGIDCGYRESGTLNVAVDRDDEEVLRRIHDLQRSLDLDARWLPARQCRALEPALAPRIAGGIHAPHDHQVSPRVLIEALAAAFAKTGGTLRGEARVTGVRARPGGVTVELAQGDPLDAGAVVIAAGAESGALDSPPEHVPVRPVKGQILRLRANPPVTVPTRRVIRTPHVYAVPRAGGELVVGATVEERGWDRAVTAGGVLELLRRAYDALPGVAELELVAAEAGLRPGTPDNGPIVGESATRGVWWATGHWRNGVLLAPITAEAIAAGLTGDDPPDEFAPFGPARFTHHARTEVPA